MAFLRIRVPNNNPILQQYAMIDDNASSSLENIDSTDMACCLEAEIDEVDEV
jgi:hypothetical protein